LSSLSCPLIHAPFHLDLACLRLIGQGRAVVLLTVFRASFVESAADRIGEARLRVVSDTLFA